MLANNVNILEISKGLGHTSLTTTQNYLMSLDDTEKKRMGSIFDNYKSDPVKNKVTKKVKMKM